MSIFGDENSRWNKMAPIDPVAQLRSQEIDQQLKQDRIKELQKTSTMLVLAPSEQDEARRLVCNHVAGVDSTDIQKPKTVEQGGHTFKFSSFPVNKRVRVDQVKLFASDPSVLVYVLDLVMKHADGTVDKDATIKQLRRTLAHVLFVCNNVSKIDEAAIRVEFLNKDSFAKTLKSIPDDDDDTWEKLVKYFPHVKPDNSAASNVDAICDEFVCAIKAFKPFELKTNKTEQDVAGELLNEHLLGVMAEVQKERIEQVRKANLESEIHVGPNGVNAANEMLQSLSQTTQSGVITNRVLASIVLAVLVAMLLSSQLEFI